MVGGVIAPPLPGGSTQDGSPGWLFASSLPGWNGLTSGYGPEPDFLEVVEEVKEVGVKALAGGGAGANPLKAAPEFLFRPDILLLLLLLVLAWLLGGLVAVAAVDELKS